MPKKRKKTQRTNTPKTLTQTAIANKIKKWLETVKELTTRKLIFSIPVTRLTSIKSLCQDGTAAGHFAIYISQRVLTEAEAAFCPSNISDTEWETHKNLMRDAIAEMENYLANPNYEGKECLRKFLMQIDQLQGDDFRKVHWTTVHFVRSGYLLKLEYAIRCLVNSDFPYYAYQLARKYAEDYSDLTSKSAPKLLEIAEFWCHYYFGQKVSEKFPELMIINQESN